MSDEVRHGPIPKTIYPPNIIALACSLCGSTEHTHRTCPDRLTYGEGDDGYDNNDPT